MKAKEIKRLLAQDPRTVFGLRMTTTADRLAGVPVFVRGLKPADGSGEWLADYILRGESGYWRQVEHSQTIASRDIVTEAEALAAARKIEQDREGAIVDARRAMRLAQRLDALGVQARPNCASVTIEDVLALDMLLTELGAPG